MARSIRFNESADAKQFNCFLHLQLLPLHRDPRLLRHWLFRHTSSETDSHPCVSVILSPWSRAQLRKWLTTCTHRGELAWHYVLF